MYLRCRLSGITENFEDQILAIEAELNLRRTHNRCNLTVFRFQWKKFDLKFWWQLLGQLSKFLPIQNFPTVFRPFYALILCKQAKSLQCFSLPTQKAIIFDLFSNNVPTKAKQAIHGSARKWPKVNCLHFSMAIKLVWKHWKFFFF